MGRMGLQVSSIVLSETIKGPGFNPKDHKKTKQPTINQTIKASTGFPPHVFWDHGLGVYYGVWVLWERDDRGRLTTNL